MKGKPKREWEKELKELVEQCTDEWGQIDYKMLAEGVLNKLNQTEEK